MTAKCKLKAAAKAAGQTRYMSPTPCPKGHGFERLAVNGNCTECARQTRRASYARIPKQRVAAREGARWRRETNPVGERKRGIRVHLKAAYGLTETQYEAMLAAQQGRCAICDDAIISRFDEKLPLWTGGGAVKNHVARVDHCHSTSAVRGLLCSKCNTGLGMFRDTPQFLLNAVRYLRESVTA